MRSEPSDSALGPSEVSPESIIISIVVPMFNEEEIVSVMIPALGREFEPLGLSFEIVIADDGSTDSTVAQVNDLKLPYVRVISLATNRGHAEALWTGLQEARGKLVLTMDGDMQHPPEIARTLVQHLLEADLDIVYGIRSESRSIGALKRMTSSLYFVLCKHLYGLQVEPRANDFRVIRRSVLDRLNVLPGETPIMRVILPTIPARTGRVTFELQSRQAGKSKFSSVKMLRLFLQSASYAPLARLTAVAGATMVSCLAITVLLTSRMPLLFAGVAITGSVATCLLVLEPIRFRLGRSPSPNPTSVQNCASTP